MSEKKPKNQGPPPEDTDRAGDVSDILGGLLGSNAGGIPNDDAEGAPGGGGAGLGGGSDLMGMLGGLMGGGAAPAGGANESGGGDLMGMLGGLLGGGAAPSGGENQGGAGDLMGMLGGLLGGSQSSGGVTANGPSIIQALLPLVLGMLGSSNRSGQIELGARSSNELEGMLGAAQSGESVDLNQIRSSSAVQDVAAQTGASPDEVAAALAQIMQMLGGQK